MNEYFMFGEVTINMQRRDFDMVVMAESATKARDKAREELIKVEGCTHHVVKSMQKV